MATSTQGIKLDEGTRARLKALGAARQRTPHWLMRTAIETYLEREEQVERERAEDNARWQNYQLSGKAVSHEKATKWLGDLAQGRKKNCPK